MERYNGKKKPRQQADKKTSRSVQTGRMTEEQRQAYFNIFDPDAMGFDGEEGV